MIESGINQCTIVLTRDCNLRCNFCFAKDAGYCQSETVSFDKLKKIVDFCCEAKVKYIFFTGGEPLLYKHIVNALKYIKEQKQTIITAIATNGILFESYDFCKSIVDNGLDYIDVSMKGRNSKEWISLTGYDGYNKQKLAIRNLSSLPVEFTCSMVITLDNVFSVCDSVKTAMENGAKQFSFTFFIENERNINYSSAYIDNHNPFELVESFVSQVDQLNMITDEWWIEYSFPLCVYTKEQMNVLEGRLAGPCQIHKQNAITFDTELNVLPCDMYFDKKIGRLGEDFDTVEEFIKLRETNPYKEMTNNIRRLPSEKCSICDYLDRCYGGCPVLWNNYSFEELHLER